jgi:peptidoglycan/xylan/chitin deacetylase (PgdA/CDA1 family)
MGGVTTRAMVKRGLGRVAASAPLRRRTQAAFADRVNVVYYHYVGGPASYYRDFYSGTTLERLDSDLTRLSRWFDFAPLADVVGRAPRRSSRPLLAVTFDDGFDLISAGALDVLERHGASATTFVMTSCVGNRDLMWRNKLSAIRAVRGEAACARAYDALASEYPIPPLGEGRSVMGASTRWPTALKVELADALWQACSMPALDEFLASHRPYLGWDGLREWIDRGHTVGHHTSTHPYCARLDDAAVQAEIVEPARELRERLDLDWLPFSYPFGSRLPAGVERSLYEQGVFQCALGIDGFAPAGTPDFRLERASAEHQLEFEVFARACAGRPR